MNIISNETKEKDAYYQECYDNFEDLSHIPLEHRWKFTSLMLPGDPGFWDVYHSKLPPGWQSQIGAGMNYPSFVVNPSTGQLEFVGEAFSKAHNAAEDDFYQGMNYLEEMGYEYEPFWEVTDAFGNRVDCSDEQLIVTPDGIMVDVL